MSFVEGSGRFQRSRPAAINMSFVEGSGRFQRPDPSATTITMNPEQARVSVNKKKESPLGFLIMVKHLLLI